MSPRGYFEPFAPTDYSPRFFGRLSAFDMECPICGRLLLIGKGKPDDETYNRVTSMIKCYGPDSAGGGPRTHPHRFLIGIVAWPIRQGRGYKGRPPDQRPDKRQLAAIREFARGLWAARKKHKGEELNTIEPAIELGEG